MDQRQETTQRRKNAARTARLLTVVATIIFVLFILSGILGN
jgi:hypothetical protein